jgi:ribosome-associated protein
LAAFQPFSRLESVTVIRISSSGVLLRTRRTGEGTKPLTTALRSGEFRTRPPRLATARRELAAAAALKLILASLEDSKAEDIVSIDIVGKSPLADTLVVASGRSQRHVAAIAERLVADFKEGGGSDVRVEGLRTADWVLIDTGDTIVHVFRPEVRAFYNLEKMWRAEHPAAPVEV